MRVPGNWREAIISTSPFVKRFVSMLSERLGLAIACEGVNSIDIRHVNVEL